jgi:hypothetical protein
MYKVELRGAEPLIHRPVGVRAALLMRASATPVKQSTER